VASGRRKTSDSLPMAQVIAIQLPAEAPRNSGADLLRLLGIE